MASSWHPQLFINDGHLQQAAGLAIYENNNNYQFETQ